MTTANQRQLRNVSPSSTEVVMSINGKTITPDQLEALQKQATEAAEIAKQAALELQEAEKSKQEASRKQLQREYEGILADAENYRKSSRNPDISEAEREKFLRWSAAAEANARQLGIELGVVAPDPDEDEKAATTRRNKLHRILAICQILGLFGILWLTLDAFFFVGDVITRHNANVAEGGQTLRPAYDLTSVQKYIYESFTMFADLPRAALLCLLVMPTVVLYIVPIIKSKKDFWTEFFNDLTPWQRAILSVITIIGFLLLSVLAHMAKP